MSKHEFGRRLQMHLNDRGWSQADLGREVERVTGKKIGRDAISTYINGRSFPAPASLNKICKALNISREDILPSEFMTGSHDASLPAFEMRTTPDQSGCAWVKVNRMMSFETATEIARLLSVEDSRPLPQ